MIIFSLLLGLLVSTFPSRAFPEDDIFASPCPETFQYGYFQGKEVGLMDIKISRMKAYGFNITQVFLPLTSEVFGFPRLEMRRKDEPKEIIKRILASEKVTFVTHFPQSVMRFKLMKVLLDDKVICERPGSSDDKGFLYLAKEEFFPPPKLVSTFRDYFPIELSKENCGVVRPQSKQPAFGLLSHGAERVGREEYPWVASLYVRGQYTCTANLISKNVALTAAHCFPPGLSHKHVSLGVFSNRVVKVWGLLIHQDHSLYKNDIALMFLEEDITDPGFSPVCLSEVEINLADQQGELVSFGETEFHEVGKIGKISLPAVSNDICRSSNPVLEMLVENYHFCAGARDGSGPCDGDSGGGWIVKEGGKWVLRGILSTSLKNKETDACDNYNYAVFIDVAKFSNWIYNKPDQEQDSLLSRCGDVERSPNRTWVDVKDHSWGIRVYSKSLETFNNAALVAPNWVLTTKDYLSPNSSEDLYIRTLDNQVIDVEKVVLNTGEGSNRLGLLKLKSSFPSTVQFICIDVISSQHHGEKGFSFEAHETPSGDWREKVADLPIYSRTDCANLVRKAGMTLNDDQFCAPWYSPAYCYTLAFDLQTPAQGGRNSWALFGMSLKVVDGGACLYQDLSYVAKWITNTIRAE